jgi:putative ribosome biogenesis GTPase RsgA
MVPHLSGRINIRMGSMGVGKSLLMSPFMPWQRQMGALVMIDLRPSQHMSGGVKTVMLVR